MMHPNEYQRGNLALLADGLAALPVDTEGYNPMFGMQTYFVQCGRPLSPLATHTCGTVACAVGWAPSFGIGKVEGSENFLAYSYRELCLNSNVWDYLFGGHWQSVDDTPHGAAARIRHYLAHGLPDDWRDQMWGRATLSYKVAT